MLLCVITLVGRNLSAQPTPQEIRAKEADKKVEVIKASKPTDSVVLAAGDPLIKDIQPQTTSLKGYWYNGKLQLCIAKSIDASGNKWEVRYYFSDTSLYQIVSDFYTVQTFISPDFFVWQFKKTFYLKYGEMFYYAADGTDRGMPPEYEDLALMQAYFKKYYAAMNSAHTK
ncbi:MAG TPA: hypothetical protein PLL28_10750 [Chitinophagales bacterium]|nr:hypothetical protein [Chitinophagales bacterium]HMZ90420.1 hypothetical protein [Chitinophagales bacterium]HNE47037.1 hypothetical protein [Chitinophagales bacterium]HNF69846.1 hypothetical protein [Chitinophagales bacterium]HNJ88869.1 hypothetical protein [Chitinophagales bacterium]